MPAMHERGRQDLQCIGAGILVETGYLRRCDLHEDILIDQGDSEALKHAYAIATNRWKSGAINGDREDILDAVKAAAADGAMECGYCAKNFDD